MARGSFHPRRARIGLSHRYITMLRGRWMRILKIRRILRKTLSKILIVLDKYSSTGTAIYDEVETTYKASLLIKKASCYNNPESLTEFHDVAINTLEVLTLNMIATDIPLEKIYELYREINRKNVIKLLLRCKKMYEARLEVKKIFKLIIKKEILAKELEPVKNSI